MNCRLSDGLSSNGSAVAPGLPEKEIFHISKGLFLADLLRKLLHAGFVDLGVNGGVVAGNKSCMSLIQGVNDRITKPIDGFEFYQPNLVLIPSMTDCGLSGMCVSMEEEVAVSELGLGEEESF